MSIVKGIGVVGNGIRNGNDASTILANGFVKYEYVNTITIIILHTFHMMIVQKRL